jgi:cell division protein FtsL
MKNNNFDKFLEALQKAENETNYSDLGYFYSNHVKRLSIFQFAYLAMGLFILFYGLYCVLYNFSYELYENNTFKINTPKEEVDYREKIEKTELGKVFFYSFLLTKIALIITIISIAAYFLKLSSNTRKIRIIYREKEIIANTLNRMSYSKDKNLLGLAVDKAVPIIFKLSLDSLSQKEAEGSIDKEALIELLKMKDCLK